VVFETIHHDGRALCRPSAAPGTTRRGGFFNRKIVSGMTSGAVKG
jgi:hypothetical protein